MIKILALPGIVIIAIVIMLLLAASKPIDCIISDSNPYSGMPMVCKAVLKIPE